MVRVLAAPLEVVHHVADGPRCQLRNGGVIHSG
jgi:hypothetical protein